MGRLAAVSTILFAILCSAASRAAGEDVPASDAGSATSTRAPFAAPDADQAPDASESDPLEGLNRPIFWFNDQLDVYVLEPTAKGWDFIVPDRVQISISNFFDNVRFPVVFINDLLQLKARQGGIELARFGVNTTAGVLGFFDPATGWGLPRQEEDFGQTLGYWGVPPGPYLVLPILGSLNPRDGFGLIVDSFTAVYPLFVGIEYTIGPRVVSAVNERSLLIEEIRNAKNAAVDYYVLVRNAYVQSRRVLVNDGEALTDEEKEDLYYFEEEE